MFHLPPLIADACAPLWTVIAYEDSMPQLLGSDPNHTQLVDHILSMPALTGKPALAAALWLYVDDLERSHAVSQSIEGPTGAFWHGIMHRREGDFFNSLYWMQRASEHPLVLERPDLDPIAFIKRVETAHRHNYQALVAHHRAEWKALFEWCAADSDQS